MKLIAQGAEAKIFEDKRKIVKHRIKKDYRVAELDERIRKFRTRREAKILNKLTDLNFPSPEVLKLDDKKMILEIEKIKGKKLSDFLEKLDYKKICREIGSLTNKMHSKGIIHGDLTTSNMILSDEDKKIYFIDFGLSFISHKDEDKAVDLHLIKQALESKHYKIFDECFKEVLKGYKNQAVIKRLEKVESRGRHKKK